MSPEPSTVTPVGAVSPGQHRNAGRRRRRTSLEQKHLMLSGIGNVGVAQRVAGNLRRLRQAGRERRLHHRREQRCRRSLANALKVRRTSADALLLLSSREIWPCTLPTEFVPEGSSETQYWQLE